MSEEGGKSPPGQSDTDPPPPDPASGHLQTQSVNTETQSDKLQTKSGNLQTHSADSLSGGKPPGQPIKHAGGAVHAQSQVYRKSAGKLEDITCRVCDKIMKFQNYATHLKFKHPQEDNKNLRGKNNKSIKNMIGSKKSGIKRPSPFAPDSSVEHKRILTNTAKDYDDNQNQSKDNDSSPEVLVLDTLLTEVHETEVSDADSLSASICNDQFQLDIHEATHDINANVVDNDLKNVSIAELNSLVTKLAPLANLESDTIAKLADNIDRLTTLSLVQVADPKCTDANEDTAKILDVDLNTLFFSCHSVTDITTKFQEFEYSAELDGILCSVCNQEEPSLKASALTYESHLEQDFTGQVQSNKFGNLKAIHKSHLKTLGHQKSMAEATKKANIEYKEDSRNKAVAMEICRIAYYLLKSGRSDTDFTTLIYLHSSNGCDVGDINHSYSFPPQFLKHVANVVEDHVRRFLSSRMVQTGYKPPAKVVADKATWQHQTRQSWHSCTRC